MGENPDFALMFVAPMDADGVKLISRASYEMVAGATGSPYDYPLSSRFDENDAILVMDNVLIPWENVLIYRDFDRCRRWTMEGGFARMYPLQACVRLAVKLDFITALLKKSLECTGTTEFRGVQADLGEVVAWRNTFWALSDSMCSEATPWVNGGLFTGSCRTANLSRTGTNGLREDQKHYRTQRYQWPDLPPFQCP